MPFTKSKYYYLSSKSGKKYLLPIINKRYSLLNVITLTTFIIEFDKFEAFFAWMGFNS